MLSNLLTSVLADEERLRRGMPVSGAAVVFAFGEALRPCNDDVVPDAHPYLAAFARAHEDRFGSVDPLLVEASAKAFAEMATTKGVERLLSDVESLQARISGDPDSSVFSLCGEMNGREAMAFCLAVQRALSA